MSARDMLNDPYESSPASAAPFKVVPGSGNRLLTAAEFYGALHKCNQLEMKMSRIRELQLSSYILIYDKAAWRWLYSHARGRFQRQLCMGQRSWSGWEYKLRNIHVRSKKTGKESKFSEQAMKIDSIESLFRRAGKEKNGEPLKSVDTNAPIHHITENVVAASKKKIVSTLLVGISADAWANAVRSPWAAIQHAKDALKQQPTEAGLARAREHARMAWHMGLFDRECWLAPPLEWIVEVEARRYVRKPKPRALETVVKKKLVINGDLEIVKYDPWSDS
jgi:hypothetical protein